MPAPTSFRRNSSMPVPDETTARMAIQLSSGAHLAGGASDRAPGLDLLRALAIIWVMFYHLLSYGVALPGFVDHGWMGVDLFFVLSGYLIGWPLLRDYAGAAPPSWRRFMLRRAFRVLPAYLVVLALYVALPLVREGSGIAPLWQFLTFTLNLRPDFAKFTTFPHAWSLCVEEQFYLLLPPMLWLLMRRPGIGRTTLAAIAILAAGMALRAWLWQSEVAPLAGTGAALVRYVEVIYNPTYNRLDGLLAGVVLAAMRGFRPRWWDWAMSQAMLLLLFGVLGLLLALQLFREPTGYAGAVFGYPMLSVSLALIMAAAASPYTVLGRRAVPGASAIAMISFSLYLTHKAVFHVLHTVVGERLDESNALAFCIYTGTALSTGAMLYIAVERPGLRLRERLPGMLKPQLVTG